MKAYWAKIGGKPAAVSKSASKKRGRQSSGRESGTPDITSAKKQKKARRKSALAKNDGTPEPPVGYTTVGDDDWQPPKAVKDAWEDGVQSVDTIEKDDEGDLWAYLVWNGKNEDGRYYRHKAKLAVCNKACPQKVCTQFLYILSILAQI